MTQAVKNAADATQVKDARRVEVDRERVYADAVRAVAEHPAGRLVLRRVLERAGLFQTGLGATDALTNFKAGKRDVALELVADLTAHAPATLSSILIATETP